MMSWVWPKVAPHGALLSWRRSSWRQRRRPRAVASFLVHLFGASQFVRIQCNPHFMKLNRLVSCLGPDTRSGAAAAARRASPSNLRAPECDDCVWRTNEPPGGFATICIIKSELHLIDFVYHRDGITWAPQSKGGFQLVCCPRKLRNSASAPCVCVCVCWSSPARWNCLRPVCTTHIRKFLPQISPFANISLASPEKNKKNSTSAVGDENALPIAPMQNCSLFGPTRIYIYYCQSFETINLSIINSFARLYRRTRILFILVASANIGLYCSQASIK